MRAHEFILNEKRRKKRKARSVTGPYYGYYYGLGTTTDSGAEGGDGGGMEEGELIPWPKGTVKVDVSDVYDWYKLGQHISNLKGLGKHDFGAGPPSTIFSFGSEELEHKFIDALKKTGLTTTDIDPVDPKQPAGMPRQKTDPTYNVAENFADGKVKGKSRPGRVKRAGASCSGSVTDLRRKAKNSSGERAKMYHWCANMKSGRKK